MWNMEMPSYGWDHINNNSQSLTFRETSSSEYWMSSVHTSSIMGNFSLNTDSSITSLHITFSYCGRLSAATTLAFLLQRACTFSLFAFSLMAELLQYLHWLKLSTKHLRVIFSISKEIWEDTQNDISWRQQWMQKIDQYVNWKVTGRSEERLAYYLSFWSCPPKACPPLVLWLKQAQNINEQTYTVQINLGKWVSNTKNMQYTDYSNYKLVITLITKTNCTDVHWAYYFSQC